MVHTTMVLIPSQPYESECCVHLVSESVVRPLMTDRTLTEDRLLGIAVPFEMVKYTSNERAALL